MDFIANSNDPYLKENYRERIESALSSFTKKNSKMSKIDKRIIAGLVFKKVKNE